MQTGQAILKKSLCFETLEALNEPFAILDSSSCLIRWSNARFSEIFATSTGHEVPFCRLADLDQSSCESCPVHLCLQGKAPPPFESHLNHAIHEISASIVSDSVRSTPQIFLHSRDITSHKEKEKEIQALAFQDPLTGLGNRNLFDKELGRLLSRAEETNKKFALLYLDLDDFKLINDCYGHLCGDEVLRQFGLRLRGCIQDFCLGVRLGGDEFVLVVEVQNRAEAERIIGVLKRWLGLPFVYRENTMALSASIGAAIYPDEADSPSELIRLADEKMYADKSKERELHPVPVFEGFRSRLQISPLFRNLLRAGEGWTARFSNTKKILGG